MTSLSSRSWIEYGSPKRTPGAAARSARIKGTAYAAPGPVPFLPRLDSVRSVESRDLAVEERPGVLPTDELVVAHLNLSSQHHDFGPAGDRAALVEVVVDAHMMRLRRDGALRVGIPHENVRVAPRCDRSLARV